MSDEKLSAVQVGQTYLGLHHQVHRVVDQAMCTAGLSLARAKVLMRLDECGAMNQATLAGLLNVAPRSVTESVDALERDGLVTREEDPHDRRARIVTLTAAGSQSLAAALVVRAKAMDEVFGPLTPTQRSQLVALLNAVRANLAPGENTCVQ